MSGGQLSLTSGPADIRIGQMADDGDVPTEESAISPWDECEPVGEYPV